MTALRVFTIAIVLAGCTATGQPRVDGSSETAFFESLNAINQQLTESEQRDLTEALMVIQLTDQETAADVLVDPDLKVFTSSELRERLDGMTFEEIFEYAKQSLVDFEKVLDGG